MIVGLLFLSVGLAFIFQRLLDGYRILQIWFEDATIVLFILRVRNFIDTCYILLPAGTKKESDLRFSRKRYAAEGFHKGDDAMEIEV